MGNLNVALGAALSGMRATQTGLDLVSRNVANAGTAGYTRKVAEPLNRVLGNQGYGVMTGDVSRQVSAGLQRDIRAGLSDAAMVGIQDTLLQRLEIEFGTPGSGTSVADRLNQFANAFRSLIGQPESIAAQNAVLSNAQTLARSFNSLSSTIQSLRTDADTQIANTVNEINALLTDISRLNREIVTARVTGKGSADLDDLRDTKLDSLSQLMGISYFVRDNGEVRVMSASGRDLVTSEPHLLSFSHTGIVGPTATYPGTLPGVTVDGYDLFTPPAATPPYSEVRTGKLAGLAELRDQILPQAQRQVDELASVLTQQLSGLTPPLELFRDGAATYNPTNVTGYAARIVVNPAVTASPWRLRDGTAAAGPNTTNPSDASLPQAVAALFETGQTFSAATGLGTSDTFEGYAANLIGFQSAQRAGKQARFEAESQTNSALQQRLQSESGVNVDQEMALMVQLQNAYSANARVVQAVKEMMDELLRIAG